MTEDPAWVTKILVGGLFTLLSAILVGIPFLLGYWGRTLKNVAAGERQPLPEWDDLGGIFNDGLRLFGVYAVYGLGLTLAMGALGCLIMVPFVAMGSAGGMDGGPEALFAALGGLGVLLFYLVIFVVSILGIVYLRPPWRARRFGTASPKASRGARSWRSSGPTWETTPSPSSSTSWRASCRNSGRSCAASDSSRGFLGLRGPRLRAGRDRAARWRVGLGT